MAASFIIVTSCYPIHRIQRGREPNCSVGFSQCDRHNGHELLNVVGANISIERHHGFGMWLECNCSRRANLRGKNGIAAYIRANIENAISRAKQMEQERPFDKFVKTAIDVAGCAGHAASYYELSVTDPIKCGILTPPARDLPPKEPTKGPKRIVSRQWVR